MPGPRRRRHRLALLAICAGAAGAARLLDVPPLLRRPLARALPAELARDVLAFVPRPTQVVSSSGGVAARLWWGPGEGGEASRELRGHRVPVVDLKFFPAGDRLVSLGADGSGIVWGATSGRALRELRAWHAAEGAGAIKELQVLSGEGDRVATLGADSSLVVWSAASGEVLRRLDLRAAGHEHRTMRALPCGGGIITGVSDVPEDPAVMWNITDGSALCAFRQPGSAIAFLELSPCGAKLVTSSFSDISVWDVASGQLQREFPSPTGGLFGVTITTAGARVIGWFMEDVFVVDVGSGEVATQLVVDAFVRDFVLLPGERRFVAFSGASAAVWDIASGKRACALAGGSNGLYHVAVSDGGSVIAACGSSPPMHAADQWLDVWTSVWDVSTGQLLHSRREHPETLPETTGRAQWWPCSVAVGPAGSVLGWRGE